MGNRLLNICMYRAAMRICKHLMEMRIGFLTYDTNRVFVLLSDATCFSLRHDPKTVRHRETDGSLAQQD
jgi:hypothetical protein